MILRFFDISLSVVGLLFLSPFFLLIYILALMDTGSPIFSQERLGLNKSTFKLIKFRTMRIGTISIATHLVDSSQITPFGRVLRRTKLDELPQLWNVLKGDMSFVGPRPCLINQFDLIAARELLGVFELKPGITGLAQLSGIDMSSPLLLAQTDAILLKELSPKNYFKFIFKTLMAISSRDNAGRWS